MQVVYRRHLQAAGGNTNDRVFYNLELVDWGPAGIKIVPSTPQFFIKTHLFVLKLVWLEAYIFGTIKKWTKFEILIYILTQQVSCTHFSLVTHTRAHRKWGKFLTNSVSFSKLLVVVLGPASVEELVSVEDTHSARFARYGIRTNVLTCLWF